MDVNFLVVSGSEILSKFIGESEQKVMALFDAVRGSTPIVIFIDEMESFLASRTGDSNSRNGAVTEFLKQTDSADPNEQNKDIIIIGGIN